MIVVYTAIFGGSDTLKRPAVGADRCVCYTDDPHLERKGWEVVFRPPEKKPRPAARALKVAAHDLFPAADATIWVDGSICIFDLPALLDAIGDADIACLPHPDRHSCYAEGATVIRFGIAHPRAVNVALELYRRDGFAPTALSTTGLLYRRNTPAVAQFNALWRKHLDAYGTNDQVHFDYCAWKIGIPVLHLPGHYRQNPFATYDKHDHHVRRKPQFKLREEVEHYLDGVA